MHTKAQRHNPGFGDDGRSLRHSRDHGRRKWLGRSFARVFSAFFPLRHPSVTPLSSLSLTIPNMQWRSSKLANVWWRLKSKSQTTLSATIRLGKVLHTIGHHFRFRINGRRRTCLTSAFPPSLVTKINNIILIGAEPTEGLTVRGWMNGWGESRRLTVGV